MMGIKSCMQGGVIMHGFMGWWGILILVGIVLVLVAAFLWFKGARQQSDIRSAISLLNEKLVQGEISEEEYASKKSVMTGRKM